MTAGPVQTGELSVHQGCSFMKRPFQASGDCKANCKCKMCEMDIDEDIDDALSTDIGSETLSRCSSNSDEEKPRPQLNQWPFSKRDLEWSTQRQRRQHNVEAAACPEDVPSPEQTADMHCPKCDHWPLSRRELDWSAQNRRRQRAQPAPVDEHRSEEQRHPNMDQWPIGRRELDWSAQREHRQHRRD